MTKNRRLLQNSGPIVQWLPWCNHKPKASAYGRASIRCDVKNGSRGFLFKPTSSRLKGNVDISQEHFLLSVSLCNYRPKRHDDNCICLWHGCRRRVVVLQGASSPKCSFHLLQQHPQQSERQYTSGSKKSHYSCHSYSYPTTRFTLLTLNLSTEILTGNIFENWKQVYSGLSRLFAMVLRHPLFPFRYHVGTEATRCMTPFIEEVGC